MPPKSRATAILLSLVIPGLGHVYLGVLVRAVLFIALPPVLALTIGLFAPEASRAVMIGAFVVVLGMTRLAAAGDAVLVPPEKHGTPSTVTRIALIVVAVLTTQVSAMTLRASVMEAYKVPSGSMMPNILVGDHFFADKGVYRKRAPRRGEAIVFRFPERRDQDFIHRVVGIACDRIEVRDGELVINGWPVPRCEVSEWSYAEPMDGASHRGKLFVEFLDDAAYYVFLDAQALGSPYQGPFDVKRGEAFVLGDNRNNAHDSRMWFGGTGGGVPLDDVKGRARMVWVSAASERTGIDLADLGPAPSADLAPAVSRCVAARPPREKTSPPPSTRDCR